MDVRHVVRGRAGGSAQNIRGGIDRVHELTSLTFAGAVISWATPRRIYRVDMLAGPGEVKQQIACGRGNRGCIDRTRAGIAGASPVCAQRGIDIVLECAPRAWGKIHVGCLNIRMRSTDGQG